MSGIEAVNINFLDLLVVGGMAYGAYQGYKDGLSGAVQKVALVIATLLAIRYYALFDGYILQLFNISPQLSPYLSGILIFFILALIMFSLLSGVTGTFARATGNRVSVNIDRVLGTVWGWIKSTLIISFIFLFLGRVNLPPASITAGSRLYGWIRGVGIETVQAIFKEVPAVMKFVHFFEDNIKPNNYSPTPNNTPDTPNTTVYPPFPNTQNPTPQPTVNERGTDLPPRREPEPQIPAVKKKPPTVR